MSYRKSSTSVTSVTSVTSFTAPVVEGEIFSWESTKTLKDDPFFKVASLVVDSPVMNGTTEDDLKVSITY
jgi:hypothetical protein